jgi:outer membrane protein TolC
MKHADAKKIAALTALAVLPVLTPVSAGEEPAPLSLSAAAQLALANDARLLPGKTALQLARLRQDAPAVWRDPEARFETGLDSEEDFLNSTLRFYPPHPWQMKAAGLEKASLTAAAAAEHRMAEVAAATEVCRLYRELQCLEKEISLAARLAEIKKERADLSEQQVEAAMETSGRALLVLWELREAEREERALRREFDVLRTRLAARTGLAPETLRLPPLDFSVQFAPADPEQAIRSALERRPDLQLLQAQLQEAESQVALAQAERIPWLNHVQTGYSDRSDEWAVQVAVSLPVFSLGRSKRNPALAEQSLRKTAFIFSEDAAAAQVREAIVAFDSAAGEWAAHRAEEAELADATRSEIQKLKELAPSAPGEWLALEERLAEAEQRLLQTLRAVYSAQADLFFATGQPGLIEESPGHGTSLRPEPARW